MEVGKIREIAMNSAQSYYRYLEDNDKGIQEVAVTELTYNEENEVMFMKLRLSAKLFDIESVFYRNQKNNKKYTVSEIQIVEYDYDKNILLVKLKESIREDFENLREQDLIVISDLKFLVERVGIWYEKNGSDIALPTIYSPYFKKDNKVQYFPELQPTPNQKLSIINILNNPFSYIWGAPGTGKTQFVLSYVILHYIMNGDRIAILAPTNNAIEQVLRGLIKMIDKAGVSRKEIIRLGTPSRKFAEEYPQVCEHKGIQQNIAEIDKQLKILERVLHYENSLEEILSLKKCIIWFEPMTKYITELTTNQIKYNQIEEKRKKKEIKIIYIGQRLFEIEKEENKTQRRINSIGNKILRLIFSGPSKHEIKLKEIKEKIKYTKKEIDLEVFQLHQLREDLKVSKETRDTTQMKIDNVLKKIKAYIQLTSHDLGNSINQISIQNWEKKKEELLEFINDKQKALSIDKHLCEEYAGLSVSNIQNKIEKYKSVRKRISETTTEERLKSVKVIACTLDGYIGRYYNEKLNVKHIFLDEAGYANIIKALTLFNHRVPISFLGDHMQLPPVCEINEKSIRNEEEHRNMFIWAQSAIFIESLFLKHRDECLRQYLENKNLNSKAMSITKLTTTHRFGASLTKVLDKHVYKINFNAAEHLGETRILYVHAPKQNGVKRTSLIEVEYIKKLVSQLKRTYSDFIILTPYRDQVNLLGKHLPDERNALKILTVHGSQGREWDTVILSVVDTYDKWFVDSQCQKSKGLNLVNTAVSRARKELIIVCDTDYWKSQDDQLISDLLRSGRELKL